jgi:hypothetical protein
LLEPTAVPRLSIIVPHRHDDSGLELTLLSILENRSNELEILIAHDGSYTDPYGLDQDEAVLIESQKGASLSSQLNLATASACSPYIQVLMPGTTVDRDWYKESLEILSNPTISAVCHPISCNKTNEIVIGLSGESLPHRRLTGDVNVVASPMVFGSVLRKRLINAVGGWLAGYTREVAEVEFALLAETLDLDIAVAETATLHASTRTVYGSDPSYEIGYACGQLACAYSSIEQGSMVVSSLAQRLGHLASGLMNPKTVAERLGWVMGIRNRSLVRVIHDRVESAARTLASQPASAATLRFPESTRQRRAA